MSRKLEINEIVCVCWTHVITPTIVVGTFCGVFRRQALDKGAVSLGANKICTGHNADDVAETVIMNSAFITRSVLQ